MGWAEGGRDEEEGWKSELRRLERNRHLLGSINDLTFTKWRVATAGCRRWCAAAYPPLLKLFQGVEMRLKLPSCDSPYLKYEESTGVLRNNIIYLRLSRMPPKPPYGTMGWLSNHPQWVAWGDREGEGFAWNTDAPHSRKPLVSPPF